MFYIFIKSTGSRDTKCTLEDLFAARCHIKICSLCSNMNAIFIKTNIQNIDQVLNDFTKSQRYDCQIITTKPKYRNTNDHTKHSSYCCSDEDCQNKSRHLRDITCHM